VLFYFNISLLFNNQFIGDLICLILAGVFRPEPSHTCLLKIVCQYLWSFFLKNTHEGHSKGWCDYATLNFDVIYVSYVYLRMDVQLSSWWNSQSNYIVKQSANSIISEFLFGEHIDMHVYSGNRGEWSTSVFLFFSLPYCSMHIFIFEPLHFWCRGVFILYIGLFVRGTTGNRIPNMCCLPLNWRAQHLILFVLCKTTKWKCHSLLPVPRHFLWLLYYFIVENEK